MKKHVLLACLLFGVAVNGITQSYSIVKTFPFGSPWDYYEEWDPNEGDKPGPQGFRLLDNNKILFYNWMNTSTIFSKTFERLYSTKARHIFISNGYWIEIFRDNDRLTETVTIAEMNNPEKVLDSITIPYANLERNFYYCNFSDNMLFYHDVKGDLICWELLGQGKTRFRNVNETQSWLRDGNAIKYGIQLIGGNDYYFGDFSTESEEPLAYKNWKSYIFPKGEFENCKQMPGKFLGVDSKGLSYFLMAYPLGSKLVQSLEPFPFALAIVDTWTRNVYIRKYPAGTWDPPRRKKQYSKFLEVIIFQSWAVHPDGDVYFFDADTKKKEYQLKKLNNDWWQEIGADKRNIARIEKNYTPLRSKASFNADNNGYNYESEFVWILEESVKTGIAEGKSVPWLKVRKLDGREGWVLKNEVYFED
jgi:hypothetical protein